MREFLTIFVSTIKRNASKTKNERYEKVTIKKNKNSDSRNLVSLLKSEVFLLRQLFITLDGYKIVGVEPMNEL